MLSRYRPARNVVWNALGSTWNGVLVVAATPWFVSRLGIEGYGIVGIWLMLQAMMGLLDMGFGATLVREFAGAGRDPEGLARDRDLLRTMEALYWTLAVFLGLAMVSVAAWVPDHWLKLHTLQPVPTGHAMRLMAVALAIQFPYALYLNGLSGLQEHGRLNKLKIAVTSLRYGGGAAVLLWRADLVWFFAAQVFVSAFQTFAGRWLLWRMISGRDARGAAVHFEMLRRLWRFSTGMALTAIAAVLLANVDRLALSKLAPTAELGKYAVAFTAASLLQIAIQPFYQAFFPRYSELVISGESQRLRDEYFRSSRLLAVFIIPMAILGWAFAPEIFRSWLVSYSETSVDVFRWLMIGVACSGLGWLPAALQQASGWTRLHASMLGGVVVLGTPLVIWAIGAFGTVGATAVWLLHGISELTLGLWLMHRRLLVGDLFRWYRSVLLSPVAVSVSLGGLSWWLLPQGLDRWATLGWIGGTGIVVVAAALVLDLSRSSGLPGQRRLLFAGMDHERAR